VRIVNRIIFAFLGLAIATSSCGNSSVAKTFCSFDFSTTAEDAIRALGEPTLSDDGLYRWYFRDTNLEVDGFTFERIGSSEEFDRMYDWEFEATFDSNGHPWLLSWRSPIIAKTKNGDIEFLYENGAVFPPCHDQRECPDDQGLLDYYIESEYPGMIPGCKILDN